MRFEIKGLKFSYASSPILEDVSLSIDDSEVMGILGPNGSGKTTLLKCMNQVLKPLKGSITYDGKDLLSMERRDISKIMGYVPQNNISETAFPTVYEVVMMGRRPYGSWMLNSHDNEIVWAAMEKMGVSGLSARRFDKLSSGQTQRVLMARAIAQGANILLLDEPTSNLDIRYQIDVMDTVKSLAKNDNNIVCAIVHDLDLAIKYCDKGVLLYQGKVIAAGDIVKVITPENVERVYGVDIIVDKSNFDRPHVIMP